MYRVTILDVADAPHSYSSGGYTFRRGRFTMVKDAAFAKSLRALPGFEVLDPPEPTVTKDIKPEAPPPATLDSELDEALEVVTAPAKQAEPAAVVSPSAPRRGRPPKAK